MRRTRKTRKGGADLFAVVVVLWIIAFVYNFYVQQINLNEISEDKARAVARFEDAKSKNEALKGERDGLMSPEYIEKVAREELGMTRSGEIPYIAGKK